MDESREVVCILSSPSVATANIKVSIVCGVGLEQTDPEYDKSDGVRLPFHGRSPYCIFGMFCIGMFGMGY